MIVSSSTQLRPNQGDSVVDGPLSQRFVTIQQGRGRRRRFLDAFETEQEDFGVITRLNRDDNLQRWVLTDMGGGSCTLMQASGSRYLDAHEIDGLDFRVVTRRRQGNDTQLWRLIDVDGGVAIRQESSGRVLQTKGTTTGDFPVVTRPLSVDAAQRWRIVDIDAVTVDRTGEYDTPPAAGSPTACVVPGLGVHNIAYRDTSGRLHELWRDARGITGTTNLTAAVPGGAPRAVGNPFAYVDTLRNTEVLLYRGSDNGVHSLYWSTGPVGHDFLSGTAGTPNAGGNPVGYYTPSIDTHNVVYRRRDGHLHLLTWVGVAPVFDGGNLTGAVQQPTAAGDPTAFVGSAGFNWVVYRSVDHRILGLAWNVGATIPNDLSGAAGAAPPAGDPVAHFTVHDDTHQVYYRDGNGHVWELFWSGNAPVQARNLTAATPGAVAATGTPTAYYSAGADAHHVVYRSGAGRLHEFRWQSRGSTPEHADLTASAATPRPSADRLAGFTSEGTPSRHVAYRGVDNHIYEVRRR